MENKKVLFICTHNSARSQLAEGLANALFCEKFEAYSAGTVATSVNPLAVRDEIRLWLENELEIAVE